jgi:esterase/lipase superfamily enzyme
MTSADPGDPTPTPSPPAAGGVAVAGEVIVYFATDRAQTGRPNANGTNSFAAAPAERGRLHLGTCRITIPSTHRRARLERPLILPSLLEDPRRHVYMHWLKQEPDPQRWYAALERSVRQSGRKDEILLFIHGYNVSFDDAAYRFAQITFDLGFTGVPLLYSWPSSGTTLAYLGDEEQAGYTKENLGPFLRKVATTPGVSRVHVIAHSMGNRPLLNALVELSKSGTPTMPPLGQVILAAPDVPVEEFSRALADVSARILPRFTMYASDDDMPLNASRFVHFNSRRAGEGGPYIVTHARLDSIDATGIDLSMLGHSYVGDEEAVLDDVKLLIDSGLGPAGRKLVRGRDLDPTHWLFAGVRPVRPFLAAVQAPYCLACALLGLLAALFLWRTRPAGVAAAAEDQFAGVRRVAVVSAWVLVVLTMISALRWLVSMGLPMPRRRLVLFSCDVTMTIGFFAIVALGVAFLARYLRRGARVAGAGRSA